MNNVSFVQANWRKIRPLRYGYLDVVVVRQSVLSLRTTLFSADQSVETCVHYVSFVGNRIVCSLTCHTPRACGRTAQVRAPASGLVRRQGVCSTTLELRLPTVQSNTSLGSCPVQLCPDARP